MTRPRRASGNSARPAQDAREFAIAEADGGRRARLGTAIAAVALIALVLAAFSPAFTAEFVSWDDEILITSNHSFRGLSPEHLRWMFTTNWMGPYQPLGWLSLAVDHALYGLSGPTEFPEAPGYHATSVVLHAAASLVFFAVARRLLAAALPEPSRAHPRGLVLAAFVAAAAFAVHPLRVESVAWVGERRDVLCGLFYVSAAWAWLRYVAATSSASAGEGEARSAMRFALGAIGTAALALVSFFVSLDLSARETLALGPLGALGLAGAFAAVAACAFCAVRAAARDAAARRTSWYAASLALFLCALLSKGLAMALPLLLLIADVWPLRRARGRPLALLAVEKLPFVVLAVVCARLSLWGQAANYGTLVSFEQHTLVERAIQAAFGLVFYLRKTIWPANLSPIYPLPAELTLGELRFAASALAAVAITAACVALARKRPAFAVAWACFAIAVAPVLGFSQAGPQIAADRYSYLSCMPFALLAGGGVLAWYRPWLTAAALATISALALLTFRQAKIWHNSTTLWEHAAALEPEAAMTHLNLGHDRVRRSQRVAADPARREALLREALDVFERGHALGPHPLLLAGQALVHQQLWEIDPSRRSADAERALALSRAAFDLAQARGELTPEYHLNLGSALFNAQHVDEATLELETFVAVRPDSFWGRFNLGFALVRNGRYADARPHLTRAVELEPTFVNAWGNLGMAAEALGEKELAVQCYERVLVLAPQHSLAAARLRTLRGR